MIKKYLKILLFILAILFSFCCFSNAAVPAAAPPAAAPSIVKITTTPAPVKSIPNVIDNFTKNFNGKVKALESWIPLGLWLGVLLAIGFINLFFIVPIVDDIIFGLAKTLEDRDHFLAKCVKHHSNIIFVARHNSLSLNQVQRKYIINCCILTCYDGCHRSTLKREEKRIYQNLNARCEVLEVYSKLESTNAGPTTTGEGGDTKPSAQ
uniref:Uncharacterized protein n=1 Tax=Panagrolaimus superbus TaxID=310955 RepID=A0A914Z810_9BILA